MMGRRHKTLFVLSSVFLIIAVMLSAWGIPKIVTKQIQKKIQLDNSSDTFDKWVKLPMPMTFNVYVFNVTNINEVNNGAKPVLQQIGPYAYDEYRERTILGYGENDTIIYTLKKTFYFNKEASGGLSEDDVIHVINFSYMGAILSVNEMMPGLMPTINEALEYFFTNLTDAFFRVKVKDLFFDGIFLNCEGGPTALGLVCGQIRAQTPSTMRPSEDGSGFYFSMFSHLNRTQSGPIEMIRGTKNIQDLGQIVSYKNKTMMSQWKDPYCGQLNGSDSTIYPPIDESKVPQRLYNFEPELCRSLYVSLVGKRSLFNISAYYYELSEEALASKSANRNNKCYCKKNWSANHDGCLIMGIMNLMPCQGAPAILSLPHFYLASEELLEYIGGGLNPEKEKHESYIYLDPVTGVVLKGMQRVQFNIELRQMGIPQLQNVQSGLFPLLWIEEGAELPPSVIEELISSHKLLSYVESFRWIFLTIAIIFVISTLIFIARSGTLLKWPKQHNSVSFILGPRNFNSAETNKVSAVNVN